MRVDLENGPCRYVDIHLFLEPGCIISKPTFMPSRVPLLLNCRQIGCVLSQTRSSLEIHLLRAPTLLAQDLKNHKYPIIVKLAAELIRIARTRVVTSHSKVVVRGRRRARSPATEHLIGCFPDSHQCVTLVIEVDT